MEEKSFVPHTKAQRYKDCPWRLCVLAGCSFVFSHNLRSLVTREILAGCNVRGERLSAVKPCQGLAVPPRRQAPAWWRAEKHCSDKFCLIVNSWLAIFKWVGCTESADFDLSIQRWENDQIFNPFNGPFSSFQKSYSLSILRLFFISDPLYRCHLW